MHHMSASYRIFTFVNMAFLGIMSILCLLPLVHVFAVSLSDKASATANLVGLFPIGFTLDAYGETIDNPNFLRSVWVSVQRVGIGMVISMGLSITAAYALSKEVREFKARSVYTWLIVFTMLFSGGLIPGYILVQKLGLINSIWALVLPAAVSPFNIILLLNFFRTSVPKSLEEASFIDGAGHVRTLLYIYLPIALPALATIGLFTLVGSWNEWFSGLIYMTDHTKYPLATFLQTVVVQQNASQLQMNPEDLKNLSQRTVKSAQIIIATLPVIAIYPFLQRYFVKGIVIGSVKE